MAELRNIIGQPIGAPLPDWVARPLPPRSVLAGARCVVEPFDPARWLRLALEARSGEYAMGEHLIELPEVSRQELYERELAAFVGVVRGPRQPDRSLEHERLVQETLLRATRRLT